MDITDARTGHRTELRPRRAGLLQATIHVGGDREAFGLGDLRALLVGDLLVRTAEPGGLQVITRLAGADGSDRTEALLEDADRLNIGRPTDISDGDGPADLHIAGHPLPEHEQLSGILTWVGAVLSAAGPGGVGRAHPLDALTVDPVEPLAVRLALLGHPHGEAVRITAADLASAQDRLTRWRTMVADLSWSPSQPAAADVVGAAFAGLATDLDATAALQALCDLERRSALGDGSRFETCLLIDRVLALELGRDIGRQAASGA